MFISSSALEKFLSDKTETTIISNKENIKYVKKLYDYLNTKFPKKEIYLQSVKNVACRLKILKSKSFILLCAACPFHIPENCFFGKKICCGKDDNVLTDDEGSVSDFNASTGEHISNKDNNEYANQYTAPDKFSDSFYIDPVEIDEDEINNYQYETPEIKSITQLHDNINFLISRIAKAEKVKNSKRFGIFFTTFYLPLAEKIKCFTDKIGKGYLYHMRKFRECADGIDCIIVVDCPLFFPFDSNAISPYELCMAFEWNGGYGFNEFRVPNVDFESYGGVSEIVKYDKQFVTVEYENKEDDYEIHEGYTGIPKDYKTSK